MTGFRPGDEVFGSSTGSYAEYAAASADGLAPKPANLTFEQAAAVPMAGLVALQAVRDHGGVRAGQKVLINGPPAASAPLRSRSPSHSERR